MALESIGCLLLRTLPVFWINDEIFWAIGRGYGRLIRMGRRVHDHITILLRLPHVVHIIGVIVGTAANPHG